MLISLSFPRELPAKMLPPCGCQNVCWGLQGALYLGPALPVGSEPFVGGGRVGEWRAPENFPRCLSYTLWDLTLMPRVMVTRSLSSIVCSLSQSPFTLVPLTAITPLRCVNPFHRWGRWGPESGSDLPGIVHIVNFRCWIKALRSVLCLLRKLSWWSWRWIHRDRRFCG